MNLLLKWLIAAGSIILVSYVVPGVHVSGFYNALAAAFVMGVLSITIKPVAKLITLPLSIITLGLFSLLLNALFFWLISVVVKGFTIDGFIPAFVGSIIVSVVNYAGDKILDKEEN